MPKHKRLIIGALTIFVLTIFVVTCLALYNKKSPSSTVVASSAPSASEADRPPSLTKSGVLKSVVPARPKQKLHAQSTFEVAATSPDTVAAEASDAAKKGVPAAQRVLADALYTCAMANMGDDDAVEAAVVKRSLVYEAAMKRAGMPVEENAGYLASIQDQIANAMEIGDACKNVPAADSQNWLSWMEKAAIAGDDEARADYAWRALDECKTREDQLANDDEYVRRRDEAFGFLEDSIVNGDCNDMVLNGFRKVSPDGLVDGEHATPHS